MNKSAQLQIRVSPDQKLRIKSKTDRAGEDVCMANYYSGWNGCLKQPTTMAFPTIVVDHSEFLLD